MERRAGINLATLVVKYSPTSFKYSVYTGIQWPEVNTVQIQCIHCIQEGNLWLLSRRASRSLSWALYTVQLSVQLSRRIHT